jgi:hypothetical protein
MTSHQSLLQLVKQLGGDKTDLDLILNVEDDYEEIESEDVVRSNEKSLVTDLKNFIRRLNIPAPPESTDDEREDILDGEDNKKDATVESEPTRDSPPLNPTPKKLVFEVKL